MSTPTMTLRGDRWVVWNGLDWEGYQALLRARGDRSTPRITYLDGSALLVSPSEYHEHLTKRMRWIAEDVALLLRIDHVAAGSTTFGRPERRGGVEADASYYVTRAAEVTGRALNLATDPPPDLVVEVVHTHPVKKSLRAYLRLGVPEVWVYRRHRVRILAARGDRHEEVGASLAFPFLTADEIRDWVDRPVTSDLPWRLALHDWIREVLAPRRGNG